MRNIVLRITFLVFVMVVCNNSYAQELATYGRKGKVLIESGYDLFAGLAGGTGGAIIAEDGNTTTGLGFEGGYFVSDDFAIKFRFGLLSSFGSITNFSVGGKYYIAGKIPLELGGGILRSQGNSTFIGNLSVGYGIALATNINLEPSIGLVRIEDDVLMKLGISFAMFL